MKTGGKRNFDRSSEEGQENAELDSAEPDAMEANVERQNGRGVNFFKSCTMNRTQLKLRKITACKEDGLSMKTNLQLE